MSEGGCVLSKEWTLYLCVCVCTLWYSASLSLEVQHRGYFMKDLIKLPVVFGETERTSEYRGNPLAHDGLQHAVPVTAAEQLHAGS